MNPLNDWATAVWPRLYGYARRLCCRTDDARDLVQETFLRLLSGPDAGRLPGRPAAYLYGALRNVWVDQRRRKAVRKAVGFVDPSALDDAPRARGGRFTPPEVAAAYHEAVARMPRLQRRVFLLYAEGHDEEEIVRRLGPLTSWGVRRSVGGVNRLLRRAFRHLERHLMD